MEIKEEKWYPVSTLLEALDQAGVSWSSRTALYNHEDKGRLTLPRAANNRGDRMVTGEMIQEIITAFQPGGNGEWHYKQN